MSAAVLTAAHVQALDELAVIVRAHPPIVAFTGAGISTESGIPDYRGPAGLWTTGSQKPLTYAEFMADPETRSRWWRAIPERWEQARAQQPNAGHRALVRLQAAVALIGVITQNIDNLHLWAGTAPEQLVELHGNTRSIRCTQCGTVFPVEDYIQRAEVEPDPPPCPVCGGILKSGTIAFGEPVPRDELQRAAVMARQAGVLLVVGSTLLVNPAARIPQLAQEAGAYLAILNQGETALDAQADFVLHAPAGEALTYLAERLLQ